jgi:hypothetical protein
MLCRTCGKQFDPAVKKTVRGGYVDECPQCGRGDRESMWVGRMGEKCQWMEVYKTNLKTTRAVLARESMSGPRPNLMFRSYNERENPFDEEG